MGDAKNMEHDTEEGPGGDITDREEEGREGGATDTKEEPGGDATDTEGLGW